MDENKPISILNCVCKARVLSQNMADKFARSAKSIKRSLKAMIVTILHLQKINVTSMFWNF